MNYLIFFYIIWTLRDIQGLSIQIVPPPVIRKQPSSDYIIFKPAKFPGEKVNPITLECEADSSLALTYKWEKNGQPFQWNQYGDRIFQKESIGTLIINSPIHEDEGYYQCIVISYEGAFFSDQVFLRPAVLELELGSKMSRLVTREGLPFTLRISPPKGFPQPKVMWFIQPNSGTELPIVDNARLTVDPDGNLHFSNTTRSDEATYVWKATNGYESQTGTVISLIVLQGPEIPRRVPPVKQYVSPQEIKALKGNSVELNCIYGGTPIPVIRWSRQENSLTRDRKEFLNYGKTLKIKDVEVKDDGIYQCDVYYGVGKFSSHSFALKIETKPFWITPPRDIDIFQPYDVVVNCVAGGIPTPEVEWLINGETVDRVKPNFFTKISPTSIRIRTIEESDTGSYQCKASNIHGSILKNFYLNVIAIPTYVTIIGEKHNEIIEGGRITFSCTHPPGYSVLHLRWTHNGRPLKYERRFRTYGNLELSIDGALLIDSGRYTCIAEDLFETTSDEVTLDVKARTKIITPPKDVQVQSGETITLPCEVVADSSLEFSVDWYKNDNLIEGNQRIFKGPNYYLTILNFDASDNGKYSCEVRTRLDQVSASANVKTVDNPFTNDDLPLLDLIENIECNKEMAIIQWKPFQHVSPVRFTYTIQSLNNYTEKWENRVISIPSQVRQSKVSLTPGKKYKFRLKIVISSGTNFSTQESGYCETPAAVPFKNPENVVATRLSPNTIIVSWTPLRPDESYGPDLYYQIVYRVDDDSEPIKSVDVPSSQSSEYILRHLSQSKGYYIRVYAFNSEGFAKEYEREIYVPSDKKASYLGPTKLNLLRIINSTSVELSWDPILHSASGEYNGYKIEKWRSLESPKQAADEFVPFNVSQTIINSLEPLSKTKIRIKPLLDSVVGPPSNVITVKTPEGVPGPVEYFGVQPWGSYAFSVVWKKPTKINGILKGYTIYWNLVNGKQRSDFMAKIVSDPGVRRTKLGRITKDSEYVITIRAMTSTGDGEPTTVQVRSLPEKKTLKPDKPSFDWEFLPNNGKTRLRVIFLPDLEKHSGDGFYVQYRYRGGEAWKRTNEEMYEDFAIIDNLYPRAKYEVAVVAIDGDFNTESDIEVIEIPSEEAAVGRITHCQCVCN